MSPCRVFQRWLDGDTLLPAAYSSVLAGGLDGVLADRVVLHEDGLVPVPEHLSHEEASTLPCAAVTAWHALVTKGRARPDDDPRTGDRRSLHLRAPVRADGRSTRNRHLQQRCEAGASARLGTWETINYVTTPDWAERTLELTGGMGVDHVIEVGGLGTMEQSFKAARPGGRSR